jgi:hypothetical protein
MFGIRMNFLIDCPIAANNVYLLNNNYNIEPMAIFFVQLTVTFKSEL